MNAPKAISRLPSLIVGLIVVLTSCVSPRSNTLLGTITVNNVVLGHTSVKRDAMGFTYLPITVSVYYDGPQALRVPFHRFTSILHTTLFYCRTGPELDVWQIAPPPSILIEPDFTAFEEIPARRAITFEYQLRTGIPSLRLVNEHRFAVGDTGWEPDSTNRNYFRIQGILDAEGSNGQSGRVVVTGSGLVTLR